MLWKTKLLSGPKWRSLLLFGVTILYGSGVAVGQQNLPCDCTASLVNAIYENRVERGNRSATVNLASYLCGLTFEDFKKLVAKSGRVDFEIYGLNADNSEAEFNQQKIELQKRLQLPDTAVSSQQRRRLPPPKHRVASITAPRGSENLCSPSSPGSVLIGGNLLA
jgi:hypothetical protein